MRDTKRDDYSDDSWSIARGFLRMNEHGSDGGRYWMGEFAHPFGLVSIYREGGLTMLDFVSQGRCYRRSWDRAWANRSLPSLCRTFVRDIQDRSNA